MIRLTRLPASTLLFSAMLFVSAVPASAEPLEAEGEVWSCVGTPVTGQNLCSVYCFNNVTGQVELRYVPVPPPDESEFVSEYPTLRARIFEETWRIMCNVAATHTKFSL